jgi:hypothetical protein
MLKLRALLFSSNWNNALIAGTFNANANNAASNSNTNISRQLVNFVNLIKYFNIPCPLAKYKNVKHCAGRIV